jgi:preprotein translocase subunit SecG
MEQIVLILHIVIAIALIGLILVQHGKGAEVGASFGSGASQTLFGSQGSGNFLTRATAILVTLFFITSLGLGYLAALRSKPKDLDELLKNVQTTQTTVNSEPKKGEDDIPKPLSTEQKQP